MDDHFGKPFSREELLAAVARRFPPAGASELPAARDHDVADAQRQSADSKSAGTRDATVDGPTLDRLAKLIGQPTVESLLGKLAEQLRGRFARDAGGEGDLAMLAREAHKLASSAGMLGFVELSQRFANLEAALKAHKDVSAPLTEVRRACVDALAEISRRLGAPAPIAANA